MKKIILLIGLSCFVFLTKAQSVWTLQQCIDTALQNNISLLQSNTIAEISKISVNQSKFNLLPNLNANESQGYNSGRSLNQSNYQFTNDNIRTNNFSVSSSVVLFNGFQNLNKIKQSEANYQATQFDYEEYKNTISLSVVNAYLQILFASENIKNAENQMKSTQEQLKVTGIFVEAGKQAESNLLLLKSQLATDKLTLINAQTSMQSAKLVLQQVLDIPVDNAFEIDLNITVVPQVNVTENLSDVYQKSLSIMPQIKAIQQRTQSEEIELKIVKGMMLPKLTLNGNLSSNYSSVSKINETTYQNSIQDIGYLQSNVNEHVMGIVSIPTYTQSAYTFGKQVSDNFGKGISLTLSVPIFNNHQVSNNIRIQQLNLQSTKYREQQVKNTLRKEVEQAYIDLLNAQAKYDATIEQFNAVQASYTNAKSKYDAGMLSATDLLIENNKLSKAQSESLQAKYYLVFRVKILDYYKGNKITM